LTQGVHLERNAVGQLELRLERLAGSILDETALHRRLQILEDRVPDLKADNSLAPMSSTEHPGGGF